MSRQLAPGAEILTSTPPPNAGDWHGRRALGAGHPAGPRPERRRAVCLARAPPTLPAEGLPVAEHLDLLFEEPPAAPGRAAAAPPPSPRHPLRTDGTRLIVAPTRPAFVSGHVQGAATRPNLIYLILIDIRRIRGVSPSTTPTPRSRYSATSIRPTGAETASRGARPRDRASGARPAGRPWRVRGAAGTLRAPRSGPPSRTSSTTTGAPDQK